MSYSNTFRVGMFILIVSVFHTTSSSAQTVEYVPVDEQLASPPSCYVKEMPVVIISYLPTLDGINLDADRTGIQRSLEEMKEYLLNTNKQVKYMLEEGSRYHGYKNTSADPFLGYRVVEYINVYDTFNLGKEVWWNPGVFRPDYNHVMERINGRKYVDTLGVKEVWLWGWHHDNIEPAESNMASPLTGDISNSERYNDDLPVYDNTYILYNYNFGRTAAEAVHNHGHQIEAQLLFVNGKQDGNEFLFREKFVGWQGNNPPIGRCGDTHHPPNTTQDYDYYNPTLVESDIEDWRPDGGVTTFVSSDTWGSIVYNWPNDNPPSQQTECHWYIYWMQNMPGNGNNIDYGSNYMTNWHKFNANWDVAITSNLGLYSPTPDVMEPCITDIEHVMNPALDLSVFPNPFRDVLHITSKTAEFFTFELVDCTGKKLQVSNGFQSEQVDIDLVDLPGGVYFLQVTLLSGVTGWKKLVKIE